MKKALAVFVAFVFLGAAGAAAPQQGSTPAPAPAESATQPPEHPARPPLKLRLDELERRPAVTFTPKDGGKKRDAVRGLPELGGNVPKPLPRSTNSTPPPVFPQSSDY